MPRPYIITALDIGSGFIKLFTVSKKPGEEDFEILSYNQRPSLGIRKGVVIDVPKVTEIISSLKEKAEQDCGRRIDNVYAGIGGGHISCTSSRGLVSVSRADQKISEEDIARVLQAAQAISLSSNKEIIEVFPKEFIVDGEGGVREAVGMAGVRLEAETLILCGFSPYLKNSSQSILNSGLQINYLFPDSLASARAVLTPREKELGVCVLDIGAGTTGLAVFEEGNLVHTAIFPIGSGHITSDIAICLKTDIDTAEKIKLEFGSCLAPSKEKKKIKIDPLSNGAGQGEPLIFSKKSLTDIIEARVSEIFAITNRELKKISRQRLLPAGVVLTGGGAKLPGIRELTKKELKLPCRIGVSQFSSAFQEDPSLSALYGLILEGIDSEEEQDSFPSRGKGIGNKLKKMFKIFIP
jgi:cell division protein FtsA